MSLINEALKRTRDASAAHRPDATSGYRVESGAPHSGVGSRSGIGTTIVVAVLAITAGAVFATRFVKHARDINVGFNEAVATVPTVQSKPSEAEAKPTEDQLVTKVLEKIKAEQVVAKPAAPEPPKFVLQGITTGGGVTEAMINGMNVHEGEDVEGARVMLIESRRVKLQFGEREIVLRLP